MSYCKRNDIEIIYGKKAITRWADLDGDSNEVLIASRIEWASDFATEYVNSRLLYGPYEVPFDTPYPTMIVNMTAMYAGIQLYDGRQIVNEDRDMVSRQRKDFDRYLRQILKGQLKLFTTTGTAIAKASECTPFVVADDSDDDTTWEQLIL